MTLKKLVLITLVLLVVVFGVASYKRSEINAADPESEAYYQWLADAFFSLANNKIYTDRDTGQPTLKSPFKLKCGIPDEIFYLSADKLKQVVDMINAKGGVSFQTYLVESKFVNQKTRDLLLKRLQ